MQPLVVVGAGGHALEVLSLVRRINEVDPSWEVRGVLVDPEYREGEALDGVPVLGGIEWSSTQADVSFVIAIGSSADRAEVAERMSSSGQVRFATLIDPDATIAVGATIGPGSQVLAGDSDRS